MKEEKSAYEKGNAFDWKVIKRLISFLAPHKLYFFFLMLVILISSVLAPSTPYFIGKIINEALPEGNSELLVTYFYVMIGLLVLQVVLQYLNTYMSGWLGQTVIRDIRIKLYRHILSMRLRFYDETPLGRLITRNISDIETLAEVFSQGLASMLGEFLMLVAIIVVMFYHSVELTLYSLCVLPLLLISTYIFKEKVKSSYDAVRVAVAKLNTFVQEHVTGMSVVQVFNTEDRELKKFIKINNEHRKANLRSVNYYSIYFPVADLLSAAGVAIIMMIGSRMALFDGYDVGMIVAFSLWLNMLFKPIRLIADRFNTLQMGIVSTARIIHLLDSNEYITKEGVKVVDSFKGKVEFNDVWLAYKEDDYILKGVSFQVNSGETVAIVGATGAGKTSIISALNRFYEINRGVISVDDRDIRDYKVKSLRENIAMVLQDVFLFSESIRENITLGNEDITDDDIWAAADLIGARVFIENLTGKLDYVVQERGMSLSVGQRQMISFLRAMVYNPKILVLDEATSSVDAETEDLIQSAIKKLMLGRTSIVIAHRLSTIQDADKIIVMDKGKVKEIGNHDELIGKSGLYANLYEMQFKKVS